MRTYMRTYARSFSENHLSPVIRHLKGHGLQPFLDLLGEDALVFEKHLARRRMAGKQERHKADRAEKFSAVRGDNLSSKRRNSADGPDFAFVRNPAGIRIKVCYASCAWKVLTESLVSRKCRRRRVKPLSRSR